MRRIIFLLVVGCALAQQPAPNQRRLTEAVTPTYTNTNPAQFLQRGPVDPAALARGKALYGTNCAYCHGEDARGGENGGNNLLRSDFNMKDRNRDMLVPLLTQGEQTHRFTFTAEQTAEVAAYIHSFRINSRDPGRMRPPTVLVGDARAGQTYFQAKCAGCHSATGDLKGVATKYENDREMQQKWIMPVVNGGRMPGPNVNIKVTVTEAGKQPVKGKLVRLDDFIVSLVDGDGNTRTFRRDGAAPKVELDDPMKGHRYLLAQYTDADIHNVSAYLETLK